MHSQHHKAKTSEGLGTSSPEPVTTVSRTLRTDMPGLPHAPSYWVATAGAEVMTSGQLIGRHQTSVAIIGGGYTGLSCAYHLAKDHGIEATVLEANRVGWGASGRNGGFAMICVGKDEYGDTLSRFSRDEARSHFAVGLSAVRTVEEIVRDNHIEIDRSENGWISVAHKPSRIKELKATQSLLKDGFGYETRMLGKEELRSRFVGSSEAHGALFYPDGFGLHPMKYVRGLARAAMARGASVHESSPVLSWTKEGSRHVLRTPNGSLVADQILVASGGYTLDSMNPWLSGRILPAISNIAVTRPLTDTERRDAGLLTTTVVSDTRKLVFYYRVLNDGRFLFGARGGIRDDSDQNRKSYEHMIGRMVDMFPGLRGVAVDYFWRGWVCLSRDQNPHLGATEDPTVHYSLAYMGNGVSLASHFGRLAAARIAGRPNEPDISLLKVPLPRFELPALREASLKAAYAYYGIKDRFL